MILLLIFSLLFLGCETAPTIIQKPIYIRPTKYKVPERPKVEKLDESKQIYHEDNKKTLAYNIANTETYIEDLLAIIKYYESYTESKKLDTKNTNKNNIKKDNSKNNNSGSD